MDAHYRARAEAVLGVDDLVQNVVSTLKAAGELKNTVLIFTSDNGFFHGEHRVPAGEGPPVRALDPGAAPDPGAGRAEGRPPPPAGRERRPGRRRSSTSRRPSRVARRTACPCCRSCANKRDWPGRAMDLETYFNPDDARGPRGPAAQLPGRAHGSLPLRQLRQRGAGAVRPANGSRSSCRTRRTIRSMRRRRPRCEKLLGGCANAPGKTCRARPAVKLKAALLDRQGRRQGQAAGGDLLPARQEDRRDAKAAHPRPAATPVLRREAGGGGDFARRADRHARADAPLLSQATGAGSRAKRAISSASRSGWSSDTKV